MPNNSRASSITVAWSDHNTVAMGILECMYTSTYSQGNKLANFATLHSFEPIDRYLVTAGNFKLLPGI